MESNYSHSGLRVLVVEDDKDTGHVLRHAAGHVWVRSRITGSIAAAISSFV
jgi:hypothetical protein